VKPYRIKAVILRHAYEVRHNANHVTYMVYLPVVNIVVWGFFTLYLRHSDRLQPGVASCLLGAVILRRMFSAFQRDMDVRVGAIAPAAGKDGMTTPCSAVSPTDFQFVRSIV